MDTKLKKSHKLTTILITLCILLPAFFVTAIYPKIATQMQKKSEEITKEYEYIHGGVGPEWEVTEDFIHYAMEASYCIYGNILAEMGQDIDFRVLEEYGWKEDLRYVMGNFPYSATYTDDNGTHGTATTGEGSMQDYENIGYVTLAFDENGILSDDIEIEEIGDNNIWQVNNDDYTWRFAAQESEEQYDRNVHAYETLFDVSIDEEQVKPKNFQITFALREDDRGIVYPIDYLFFTNESLMMQTGAFFIPLIAGLFVTLMAFVLPCFKKLETGFEKLFCQPLEMVILESVALIGGVYGMHVAMASTCNIREFPNLDILGYEIPHVTQWGFLLVVNFLGWAVCFFFLYTVIACIRQFFCGPMYYFKNRILCVRFVRWAKQQCVKLYRYITNIDISEKLNTAILTVVLINFVVLTLFCTLWFMGIVGLVIYSVALYILLRKYGKKLQDQYQSVLDATNQMSEGNLKIELDNDLGVLTPIGDSLKKVQQGFSKAVAEEAKSQNMKTELITNVSHDLKTPLTSIITYVDLLKEEGLTEEKRRSYVQILEQKSQRLKVLIEDLFEVSKAQSGNVTMNFMEVDVVSLMKQVRSEMSDQLEESTLMFRWNLPEGKVLLLLDGQRTYRVFENLLNNVLKYAMPYSRVYVDILDEHSHVKVLFRNISAKELSGTDAEHLTERFVRGDTSRNSEGSGLGLAIARSFVELQNGKLQIETDGDLFKVTILWNK